MPVEQTRSVDAHKHRLTGCRSIGLRPKCEFAGCLTAGWWGKVLVISGSGKLELADSLEQPATRLSEQHSGPLSMAEKNTRLKCLHGNRSSARVSLRKNTRRQNNRSKASVLLRHRLLNHHHHHFSIAKDPCGTIFSSPFAAQPFQLTSTLPCPGYTLYATSQSCFPPQGSTSSPL